MTVRVHRENLRFDADFFLLLVDVLMIALVTVNLSLILFDWLFLIDPFRAFLAHHAPAFHDFYAGTIHDDFLYWDLMFVAVYLTEFVIGWAIAVARRTYAAWFYYPFAHWYDLLGLIPVGSFRWLRVLRLVSLLYRLQKRGLVDLSDTWLGRTLKYWYDVVVEEISDAVVTNVLSGAQRELRSETPLVRRIEHEVLEPRRELLVDFIVATLVDTAARTHGRWRDQLGEYLGQLVREALLQTSFGERLGAIPGAGPRLMRTLADRTEEFGLALADQLVADLSDPASRPTLDAVVESILIRAGGDRRRLDALVRDTLVDLLEEVKRQVNVKHWRLQQDTTPGSDRSRHA